MPLARASSRGRNRGHRTRSSRPWIIPKNYVLDDGARTSRFVGSSVTSQQLERNGELLASFPFSLRPWRESDRSFPRRRRYERNKTLSFAKEIFFSSTEKRGSVWWASVVRTVFGFNQRKIFTRDFVSIELLFRVMSNKQSTFRWFKFIYFKANSIQWQSCIQEQPRHERQNRIHFSI